MKISFKVDNIFFNYQLKKNIQKVGFLLSLDVDKGFITIYTIISHYLNIKIKSNLNISQ